jgi:hypothetical protein
MDGAQRTLVQHAAKVGYESTLPIFGSAAKVRFRETGEVALLTWAQTGPSLQLGGGYMCRIELQPHQLGVQS